MYWIEQTIHVIDFEGIYHNNGFVEYGVVTIQGGNIQATHTCMCSLNKKHDTQEIPNFSDKKQFFFKLRQGGYFAAHRASVEHGFLKRVWAYPSSNKVKLIQGWGPWIDTCILYAVINPGLASYALNDLIHTFSLKKQLDKLAKLYCPPNRRRQHCALYDALACTLLLFRIEKELSIKWLIDNSITSIKERNHRKQQILGDW